MQDLTAFDDLFTNPAWFLKGFDGDQAMFTFVRTGETIIRQSAFLDGRTPISVDDRVLQVPADAAMAWVQSAAQGHTPDRIIAHISFCGSTLLGRLLQGDGHALGYSEPHVLVELATLKAKQNAVSTDATQWQALLRFALIQYRKSWGESATFIKPSNWVNTLLADLIDASPNLKLAIIDTDLEDYLIANLRGGKARLQYSLNLLNHFLSANQTYRAQVLEVERAELEPVQRLLRLLMIVYETQQRLLDYAIEQSSSDICRISKADLQSDPPTSIAKIVKGLDLALPSAGISTAIAREMSQHAKDTSLEFRPDIEAAENIRLRRELDTAFSQALAWRETNLRSVA